MRWARQELGTWQGIAVGIIFCGSFGVSSTVAFDFHEVAFAVPILAFSLTASSRRRTRAAVLWALPLVLVKEDLGVTVAAIGGVLLLRRRRRRWRAGALLVLFGLAATALEVKVLIPVANPNGAYGYSDVMSDLSLDNVIHESSDVLNVKIMTLMTTLSVGIFLASRSTLLLVGLPTIAWRFLSGNSGYWSTGYHYSLVLMSIIVAAVVEVLVRQRARGLSGIRFVRWALITSVAGAAVLGLAFPLLTMVRNSFWQPDPRLSSLRAAVALVPPRTTVAVTDYRAPHLVDRDTVMMFWGAPAHGSRPESIVADMTDGWPDSPAERAENVRVALRSGYVEVFSRDDVVVLERTTST